jgi:hypothetical protein
LAADFYSVDSLELIVSLIYLIKHGPEEGYNTKPKIIRYLRSQKSQFSAEDVEIAWQKIKEAQLWANYLAKLGA